MIIKRKPRILFIEGYSSEERGLHSIYDWLCKYLDARVDNAHIPSDPKIGLPKFKKIDLSKYSMVIGFSMGGLYAGTVSNIPRVLINPGYSGGKNNIYPELRPLENLAVENPETIVFFSDQDKFGAGIVPGTKKSIKNIKAIYTLPGKHVPSEEEIKNIIAPKLNDRGN